MAGFRLGRMPHPIDSPGACTTASRSGCVPSTLKLPTPGTTEDRSKLEQLLGVDRSIVADLQTGLAILGPLIASAAAAFLPPLTTRTQAWPCSDRQARQSSRRGRDSSGPKQVNMSGAGTHHSLIGYGRAPAPGLSVRESPRSVATIDGAVTHLLARQTADTVSGPGLANY